MITRVANEQIVAESHRVARALDALDLPPRAGVSALLPNCPEFLYAARGVAWSGRVWTPICWHWTPDEVAYVVGDSDARVMIAHVDFAEAALAACGSVPEQGRFSVGGELPGFRRIEEMGEFSDAPLDDPVAGDCMLYTSGTTGRPKGVLRPPGEPKPPPGVVALAGRAMLERFSGDAARGPHLVAAPLYHAGPSAYCEGAILLGADIVLLDRWDAREFLEAVERERICSTFLVPTHFVRLLRLDAANRNAADTSSLRLVVHGAAPVSVEVKRQMIDWLGPILFEFYGGTEGGGVGIGSEEWLAHPGSVGRPAQGVEVTILDAEGAVCAPGVQGDVYFRGSPNFEYKGDADKTAAGRRGDRFTLGDIGYLDEDGYLYLCDRSADVIISGGVNVYPAQVESVLLAHPAVADCCVVGVAHPEWGEEVRGVVQLEPGHVAQDATAQQLIAHCRSQLAGYQVPRRIDFVSSLPRTETGKLARRSVRDGYR
jgi:long-chain acyl-CoA synthetase